MVREDWRISCYSFQKMSSNYSVIFMMHKLLKLVLVTHCIRVSILYDLMGEKLSVILKQKRKDSDIDVFGIFPLSAKTRFINVENMI